MADGRIEKQDIVTDDAIKNIIVLKNEIENSAKALIDLTKQLTALNDSTGKYSLSSKTLADYESKLVAIEKQLAETQKQLADNQAKYKTVIDDVVKNQQSFNKEHLDAIKLNKEYDKTILAETNSLAGLTEKNRQLTKERNLTSRSTEEGRLRIAELNKQIESNTKEIVSNGTSMEKQRANIANYSSALEFMPKPLQNIISGFQGALKSGLEFVTSPIGGAFSAIAIAIGVAYEGLHDFFTETVNGKAMMREVTEQYNAIWVTVKESIRDSMAELFRFKTANDEINQSFWDKLNHNRSLGKAIAEEQTRLNKTKKAEIKEMAQLDLDIAENREIFMSGEINGLKATREQRKVAIEEAIRLTQEKNKKEIYIATEEARIAKYKSDQDVDNSEKSIARAEAEANVLKVAAEGKLSLLRMYSQARKMNEQDEITEANDYKKRQAEIDKKRQESDQIFVDQMMSEIDITQKQAEAIKKAEDDEIKAIVAKNKIKEDGNISIAEMDKTHIEYSKQNISNEIDELQNGELTNKQFKEKKIALLEQIETLKELNKNSNLSDTEKIKNAGLLEKALLRINKLTKENAVAGLKEIQKYANQVADIASNYYQVSTNLIESDKQKKLDAAQTIYDKNIANGMSEVEAKQRFSDEQTRINQEFAIKEAKIKRKAAEWEKAASTVSIVTNAAISAMAAWKSGNPILVAIMEGLIAVQTAASLAIVATTPLPEIPEYWKGTQNHIGGLATVGEQGTELGVLPTGEKFLTPATETILDMPKGTKIFTHNETKRMLQNENNSINFDSKSIVNAIEKQPKTSINVGKEVLIAINRGNDRSRYISKLYR